MTTQTQATPDQMQAIRSIMTGTRIAMLTTVNAQGALHSHPMTVQETEFDGDCWFLASADSDMVAQLQGNPSVNVAYSGSSAWLSLAGTAEVVRDQAKKTELWNTFVESWFTDGESDPSVVLIRVTADSAQYWDSPGRLVTLVSMIKARVTDSNPAAGHSASVDL